MPFLSAKSRNRVPTPRFFPHRSPVPCKPRHNDGYQKNESNKYLIRIELKQIIHTPIPPRAWNTPARSFSLRYTIGVGDFLRLRKCFIISIIRYKHPNLEPAILSSLCNHSCFSPCYCVWRASCSFAIESSYINSLTPTSPHHHIRAIYYFQ